MEQAQNTSTTGNTRTRSAIKSRGYMVTFWNHDYPRALPNNVKYMCTCEDSTKDGKFHGHAFIYFVNPVGMKSVKKLFGQDAHLEKPHKNSECISYVLNTEKRKHDFQEFGEKPMDNGCKRTIAELKAIENPDELDWRQFNTWKKLKDTPKKIKISEWHKDVEVVYIQGPSGAGKSNMVKDLIMNDNPEAEIEEIKFENGFYNGIVDGTGIAIYDDFRDSHMKASEFINMIDYNIHNMNIKGGSVRNQYNKIYITSVQRAEELYKNMSDEPRKQWMRRIHIVNLYKCSPDQIDIDC